MKALGVLALTLLAALPLRAPAETLAFRAELDGTQEVPRNDSTGTGKLEATYDTQTKTFEYTLTFAGLSGSATVAHFHGAAKPGQNGGAELPVAGLPVSPMHEKATLTDSQAADLEKGLWYLNIHTTAHPKGEIRGQLVRQGAPESAGVSR